MIGRAVAADPDFKYGDSIAAVGATGAVWDGASLAAYVADPDAYLKSTLADDATHARSLEEAGFTTDVACCLAVDTLPVAVRYHERQLRAVRAE